MHREFLSGGTDEPVPNTVEVDIDAICQKCFAPADKVYYNQDNKKLLVVCINGDRIEQEGNWSKIFNG